jgi:hypothetical protein
MALSKPDAPLAPKMAMTTVASIYEFSQMANSAAVFFLRTASIGDEFLLWPVSNSGKPSK